MSESSTSCVVRAVAALAAALLSLTAAPPAGASSPWDEPFETPGGVLAAAAAEVPAGEDGVDVLLEEQVIAFAADGSRSVRHRFVYRVNQQAAVAGWSTVGARWSPWHQARPEVRARVIGAEGREAWLDPATLTDQPVPSPDPRVFTDRRLLEGPLPGIRVGALVVLERAVRDTAPFFAAGIADRYFFGRPVPVVLERLVIEAPLDLSLRHETHLLPAGSRREESGGVVRWIWELGPLPAQDTEEEDVPGDVIAVPTVSYAVGESWEEVGAAYARWVDERADGVALPAEATRAVAAVGGRRAKVAAALDWIHHEVRYVALALGDTGIVPRAPAETLARQYGDCKDKATLLVALLRQAGIAAEVALLATGPGADVDPDLPGLGLFDHAIVHLPADPAAGEPELWIDATADAARVGQLPSANRNRLALVVRAAGSELRRTPSAASSENLYRLDRVVELSDWGAGRLTDRSSLTGAYEIGFRASGTLESWAREEPGLTVEEPPTDDPARPLVIAFPSEEAVDSDTVLDSAHYAMSVALLTEDLPLALLAWDENTPRRHDLEVAEPFINEVHLRVVPPLGFEPIDLPEPIRREVGVARFEREVEVDEDGAVVVRLRFDSGPSRLTAEQVAATGRALAELTADEVLTVSFESRGHALLGEGRVPEAVTELRRVVATGERAAHHARLAHALLAAGLGEAARREARAAVDLEPASAFAHQTLGFVLFHDLFGREARAGWDLSGSETALRRAIDLDSNDQVARYNLGLLLEYDGSAVRYGAGARLDEAARQYRALRDELEVTEYDGNLLTVLWRRGRYDEAATLAAESTAAVAPWFALAATAIEDGVPAALRKAAAVGDRGEALSGATQLLTIARQYAKAGELAVAAAQGAPDAAARLAQAAQLRKLVAYESLGLDPATPRGALLRVVRALVLPDEDDLDAILAAGRALGPLPDDEVERLRESYATIRRGVVAQGGDPAVLLDAIVGSVDVQQDGSPSTGFRVRVASQQGQEETWFFAAAPGGPVLLVPDGGEMAPLGAEALRFLDAGDAAAARQWLDWAREAAFAGSGDEAWSGSPIAAFWRRGEDGDEAAIRRAALALLATGSGAEAVLAEVEAAYAAAEDAAERFGWERALILAYGKSERWQELVELARRRLTDAPHSDIAYLVLAEALVQLGRDDELVALSEERLARRAGDAWALRWLYQMALRRGEFAAARGHLAAAAASTGRLASDFNDLAWLAVLVGEPDDEAVADAYRGVQGASQPAETRAALHTLATVLADLDRPLEAKDVILQALDVTSGEEPESHDWYVLGRIAESYGEKEAACSAYARVEEPEAAWAAAFSTRALAERRLAALAAECIPVRSARSDAEPLRVSSPGERPPGPSTPTADASRLPP